MKHVPFKVLFMLAVIAILALASCAAPPAAPAPAAAPTQAPAAATQAPAPEAKPDVYKVGLINHLTGDAAAYGQSMKKGTELALDVINGAGGIGGTKVEVIFEDDRLSAADAQTAFLKLTAVRQGAGHHGVQRQLHQPEPVPEGAGNEDRPDLQHLHRAEPEGLWQVLLLGHGLGHGPGTGMGQGRGGSRGQGSRGHVHQQRLRHWRQGHFRPGVRDGRRQGADRATVRAGQQGFPHRGRSRSRRPTPRWSSSSTTWPRAALSSSRPKSWAWRPSGSPMSQWLPRK